MSESNMNEVAPWGTTWGRTSKKQYKNIVTNLAYEIEKMKAVIYMRDLLNNPCHESNRIEYEWQHLNKKA